MEWTDQDTLDARRLIGVMDERKRDKLSGGFVGEPEPIADQPQSLAEKAADSESGLGLGALDRCPPVTPPREVGSDRVASRGTDNGLGERADFRSETGFSFEYKDTARPALDESLVGVDRAKSHAPEDW